MPVFGYDDIGTHATMLVDEVRMRAFAAAIARAVRPGEIVVDVGSGSGVLALLCAKAGARRVYAIERGPMAKLIEQAAITNGLANIVRVVRKDARDVSFDGPNDDKPTLMVSEMIGSFGIDEDYLGLLGTVRARCAAGCWVLPATVSVQLALASLPALSQEVATVRDGLGVRLHELAALLLSRVSLAWVDAASLVTTATPAACFAVGDRPPRVVGGPVLASRAASANAIVGWFHSELVEGVSLSSAPGEDKSHWSNVVFPLDAPLELVAGEQVELAVRPRMITDRGTWSWSARAGSVLRRGDAMGSIAGAKDDVLRQLGVRPLHVPTLDPRASSRLQQWAKALAGGVDELSVLASRLRAADPGRYADQEDAEREIMALVRMADS